MRTGFHQLKISHMETLTEDAIAITLDVPESLADVFSFVPGHYLTFRAVIHGEELRRSYSICAPIGAGLRVGIKKIEGGKFSNFASRLNPGDTLEVMPPQGRFVCDPQNVSGQHFLLIAAGSGITPILSIAASLLEANDHCTVTLVYGNQRTASIMFRQEIEDIKDRFMEQFHVYHVLSREAQDVDLFSGRIDPDRITGLVEKGIINPKTSDGIYICGPFEMSKAISDIFLQSGINRERIHTELFNAPDAKEKNLRSPASVKAASDGVNIEVILDGSSKRFVLSNADQTILDAAHHAGLELPFSCTGGMCATCRCKLVTGKGEMDNNYSLDDWELEAGFVLACQLQPTTREITLDFDAV